MGKRTDYAALRQGFGLARGFGDEFIQACERNGVPIEAVHRLVTPPGRTTMDEVVRRVLADWLAEQPRQPEVGALPPHHYRVRMTYAPMPSLADLKVEFGKDNVSDIFDGREWELHSSCVGMDRTPGERIFFVHDVSRDWEREEQIAWGLAQRTAAAPNGYRPATHDEEYEFQKAHPKLLNYVALGSSALDDGYRFVACG